MVSTVELDRRMNSLQARIDTLERFQHTQLGRPGSVRRQPRLAQTVNNYLATPQYPAPPAIDPTTGKPVTSPPPANVFPFVFIDGYFDQVAGYRIVIPTDRTTDSTSLFPQPAGMVCNIAGSYIPVNTIIPIFEDGELYWTTYGAATPAQNSNTVNVGIIVMNAPFGSSETIDIAGTTNETIHWEFNNPYQLESDLAAYGLKWHDDVGKLEVIEAKNIWGILSVFIQAGNSTRYSVGDRFLNRWQLRNENPDGTLDNTTMTVNVNPEIYMVGNALQEIRSHELFWIPTKVGNFLRLQYDIFGDPVFDGDSYRRSVRMMLFTSTTTPSGA